MCLVGDVGSNANTSDESLIQGNVGFDILPGSDDVYNWQTGKWETLSSGLNMRLTWLILVGDFTV